MFTKIFDPRNIFSSNLHSLNKLSHFLAMYDSLKIKYKNYKYIYTYSGFTHLLITHINMHTYRYGTTLNQINKHTYTIKSHFQPYTIKYYTNLHSISLLTQILLHKTSIKSKVTYIYNSRALGRSSKMLNTSQTRIKPLLIPSVVNILHE